MISHGNERINVEDYAFHISSCFGISVKHPYYEIDVVYGWSLFSFFYAFTYLNDIVFCGEKLTFLFDLSNTYLQKFHGNCK